MQKVSFCEYQLSIKNDIAIVLIDDLRRNREGGRRYEVPMKGLRVQRDLYVQLIAKQLNFSASLNLGPAPTIF